MSCFVWHSMTQLSDHLSAEVSLSVCTLYEVSCLSQSMWYPDDCSLYDYLLLHEEKTTLCKKYLLYVQSLPDTSSGWVGVKSGHTVKFRKPHFLLHNYYEYRVHHVNKDSNQELVVVVYLHVILEWEKDLWFSVIASEYLGRENDFTRHYSTHSHIYNKHENQAISQSLRLE